MLGEQAGNLLQWGNARSGCRTDLQFFDQFARLSHCITVRLQAQADFLNVIMLLIKDEDCSMFETEKNALMARIEAFCAQNGLPGNKLNRRKYSL